MPKLNKKMAKAVDNTEAKTGSQGDFPLLPKGRYIATLGQVEDGVYDNGGEYWEATYTDLYTMKGEKKAGRQWYRINLPNYDGMPADYEPRNSKKDPEEAWESLQEHNAGILHGWFEAHGYETNSDTDEMAGERVVLNIGQRTIQSGARKGDVVNNIIGVEEIPDDVDLDDLIDEDDDDEAAGSGF